MLVYDAFKLVQGIINCIICTPKPYFISPVETIHFNPFKPKVHCSVP